MLSIVTQKCAIDIMIKFVSIILKCSKKTQIFSKSNKIRYCFKIYNLHGLN